MMQHVTVASLFICELVYNLAKGIKGLEESKTLDNMENYSQLQSHKCFTSFLVH
uniref:Uncharacterized protein n=1 Tax=Rhizophora mucronata TaxID=61149 RepID=A0A2P2PNR2_RHIMU